MFEALPTAFPNNIVFALKDHLEKLDPDVKVFLRPIQKSDPIQSIAITAAIWVSDEGSEEFIGSSSGFTGPTLNRYIIGIQTFNQDTDEERGLSTQSAMATAVRTKLSWDIDVRVSLSMLESTAYGCKESFRRSIFQNQRFLSNEVEGQFYFLSNTELLVETETTPNF